MKSLLLLGAALALGQARTEATIYAFNLHGSVDSGFTEYYGGNPYLYELWQDPLPDMTRYYARAGDVLDVTVTLDRAHTIPASVPGTLFTVGVHFYGISYPEVYGSSATTASFFSQGATVFATTDATPSSSSGGTLSPTVAFYPTDNTALTFDRVRFHSVVSDTQGTILNLYLAELSVTRIIPVPEPAVASLLAVALAALATMKKLPARRTPCVATSRAF